MLEKYYNERMKNKNDVDFKDLSEDNKKSIENSTGFVFYKFDMAFHKFILAWNDFGKALKNAGFK